MKLSKGIKRKRLKGSYDVDTVIEDRTFIVLVIYFCSCQSPIIHTKCRLMIMMTKIMMRFISYNSFAENPSHHSTPERLSIFHQFPILTHFQALGIFNILYPLSQSIVSALSSCTFLSKPL